MYEVKSPLAAEALFSMPLRKGLPVRIPSCLCDADKVVCGLLSPSSAAVPGCLQTSSSRPHGFSSQATWEDTGDRSLPSVHTMGELVSTRPWPQIPRRYEGFWVPSPTPPHRPPSQPPFRGAGERTQADYFCTLLRKWAKWALTFPSWFHRENLLSYGSGQG